MSWREFLFGKQVEPTKKPLASLVGARRRGELSGLKDKSVKKRVKKKPLRDAFFMDTDWPPFLEYLKVKFRSSQKNRAIISFFIMGATGLRVDEVRQMTISQLYSFAKSGSAKVYNIKRIGERDITLSTPHYAYLTSLLSKYPVLDKNVVINLEGVPLSSMYLGSNSKDPTRPVPRAIFNTSLNLVLKKYTLTLSEDQRRLWNTHSFRIGLVTSLLRAGVALDSVRYLIGHKSSATTSRYNRYIPTENDRRKMLDLAFNNNAGEVKETPPFPL